MNLALTAIAIFTAAICLWAWPALEAEEAKRRANRETARRERLTEEDIARGKGGKDQP